MSARAKDPRKFVPPESTSRDAVREWTDAVGARTADAMDENVMEDAMALRVPGSAVKYPGRARYCGGAPRQFIGYREIFYLRSVFFYEEIFSYVDQ
jgi:hypothetical protein